jgi:hypothetical protein
MRHPAWFLAYHGCDKAIGEAILRGKDVLPSTNDHDWLGEGAYFWENSYSRALEWAKDLKARPELSKAKIKHPFVIGAIVDAGDCLDLSEDSSLKVLKTAYDTLKEIFEIMGRAMPENKAGYRGDKDFVKRQLDCATINLLHELRVREKQPPFHTVRGIFIEGDPLFPGSMIRSKTHVQWCVRDPKKHVIAYFRPRPRNWA